MDYMVAIKLAVFLLLFVQEHLVLSNKIDKNDDKDDGVMISTFINDLKTNEKVNLKLKELDPSSPNTTESDDDQTDYYTNDSKTSRPLQLQSKNSHTNQDNSEVVDSNINQNGDYNDSRFDSYEDEINEKIINNSTDNSTSMEPESNNWSSDKNCQHVDSFCPFIQRDINTARFDNHLNQLQKIHHRCKNLFPLGPFRFHMCCETFEVMIISNIIEMIADELVSCPKCFEVYRAVMCNLAISIVAQKMAHPIPNLDNYIANKSASIEASSIPKTLGFHGHHNPSKGKDPSSHKGISYLRSEMPTQEIETRKATEKPYEPDYYYIVDLFGW